MSTLKYFFHNILFVLFSKKFCLPISTTSQKADKSLSFVIQRSPDMQNKLSPVPLRRPSASYDFDNSRMKNNGTVDHFGLFSPPNAKQEFSTTPPSWITFDCKTEILLLHIFCSISLHSSYWN